MTFSEGGGEEEEEEEEGGGVEGGRPPQPCTSQNQPTGGPTQDRHAQQHGAGRGRNLLVLLQNRGAPARVNTPPPPQTTAGTGTHTDIATRTRTTGQHTWGPGGHARTVSSATRATPPLTPLKTVRAQAACTTSMSAPGTVSTTSPGRAPDKACPQHTHTRCYQRKRGVGGDTRAHGALGGEGEHAVWSKDHGSRPTCQLVCACERVRA
jgi:hypothetical protein